MVTGLNLREDGCHGFTAFIVFCSHRAVPGLSRCSCRQGDQTIAEPQPPLATLRMGQLMRTSKPASLVLFHYISRDILLP